MREVIAQVVDSGWWLLGPRTRSFCEAFAEYVGGGECIGVANGTDALELALRVVAADSRFGGGSEDGELPEVVLTANAGGYSTIACHLGGLLPVYVDIDADTLLLSIDAAVAATSSRTLAVVATHLYGGLVDVPALRRALDRAGRRHVAIIEDCAQAHGLRGRDGMAGSFGDLATFSFYPTKNLGAFGDGGAVLTRDADLAKAVRTLHQYGWSRKYAIDTPYGRNSRLDEIQAAVLHSLLPHLDGANAARVSILDAYADAAPAGVSVVRSPQGSVAHLAIVRTPARDALQAHMTANGVTTDIHYPILDCDQAGLAKLPFHVAPGDLPNSRAATQEILTLPCFPTMRKDEIAKVCDALASFKAA
ncbi:DegT/DnrJ/EryC1/StrS family aminotransferase [Sphingomonas sp. IC-56]|uniref:DegT/DnrJ/EryC1/StrS family aminotransferase n=1 Tax=Sphingomonas sp. IC-56 TaxID=2898529 RepID=UPI001E314E3F|nr:DegT/DnrJ/EryC1/StrS family aminotransferase [Sphingomonas sp. IC-56]